MAETWTVRRLRAWVKEYLAARAVESPLVCADLLLAHVLNVDRMRLYMDPERLATDAERDQLRTLVQRAGQHEPVQYLVGSWSFFGLELEVGPATLIPRPSTESLVSEAAERLRPLVSAGTSVRVADFCTGTGCIAIALARTLIAVRAGRRQLAWQRGSDVSDVKACAEPVPAPLEVHATELAQEAVAIARRNVERHGLSGVVTIYEGDLDRPLEARSLENTFDLICANPPYISDAEWAAVPRNVRDYEPAAALRAGHDGFDLIRPIVARASRWLRPGGSLLVEISASQGAMALSLAGEAGLEEASILLDLEGHPRVLAARARV